MPGKSGQVFDSSIVRKRLCSSEERQEAAELIAAPSIMHGLSLCPVDRYVALPYSIYGTLIFHEEPWGEGFGRNGDYTDSPLREKPYLICLSSRCREE